MSRWSEQILHQAEIDAEFDRGQSYARFRKKIENDMWQYHEELIEQEEERPIFRLPDGTILDGEPTLKTA
jgi:hypothetical protein